MPETTNIMVSVAIGAIVVVAVGYAILKKYSATNVLMLGGIVLLLAGMIMGHSIIEPGKGSTGYQITDLFEFIKILLSNRAAELGMMIMILCGFATYMSHIGANDRVVKLLSHPLQYIKSPYVLMVAAYFIACLMSFAVSSAAGLGVLLMATFHPLMVNMGINRGASAAICASPAAIILSPTSGDVIIAAETAGMGGEKLIEFAFQTTLPISIMAIISIAIAHFFWQRYLDRKEQIVSESVDVNVITTDAPVGYAILPFLPIIGVLIFSGKISLSFLSNGYETTIIPLLNIITILIICIFVTAIIEFIRHRKIKKVFDGVDSVYRGMGDAFVTVVVLLVAAGVFAHGLKVVGFLDGLIDVAQNLGEGATAVMLVLVVVTMLAAIATGSGNAPFYAFVELIPKIATQMGINPGYLVIPMLQASNLGRSMSPVSGVVVATSGMAKISPFEVVKRTSVPMLVGLAVVIIATEIMVPSVL